ncbi:MAG: hypothetical protein M1817_001644 [Caeruleum heppii]|nr:MAG: hypothetical protein M1817_001644 [Caeruleum heppii]
MNGKDCAGRPVCLLNDSPRKCRPHARPSYNVSSMASSSGSNSSSSRGNAPTPELSRSDSSGSRRNTDSPSPRTPAQVYEGRSSLSSFGLLQAQPQLLPKHDRTPSHNSTQSSDPHFSRERPSSYVDAETKRGAGHRRHQSVAEPSSSSSVAPDASKTPVQKKFPCQLAQEYGCWETFTTSGHASRHAKKHTGEKKVACPKCPKTFARKDNMKQHLKTHDGARVLDRISSSSRSPVDDPGHHAAKLQRQRHRLDKRASSPLPRLTTDMAQQRVWGSSSPVSSHHEYFEEGIPRSDVTISADPLEPSTGYPRTPLDSYRSDSSALTPGLHALLIAADALPRS